MNPLNDFDNAVARMKTVPLTSNTKRITELPDEFEPNKSDHPDDYEADELARMIP